MLLDGLLCVLLVLVAGLPVRCTGLLQLSIQFVHAFLVRLRPGQVSKRLVLDIKIIPHELVVLLDLDQLFFLPRHVVFQLNYFLHLVILLELLPHVVDFPAQHRILLALLTQQLAFLPELLIDDGLLSIALPPGFLDLA